MDVRGLAHPIRFGIYFSIFSTLLSPAKATATITPVEPLIREIAQSLQTYRFLDQSLDLLDLIKDLQMIGWRDRAIESSVFHSIPLDLHAISVNRALLKDAEFISKLAANISNSKATRGFRTSHTGGSTGRSFSILSARQALGRISQSTGNAQIFSDLFQLSEKSPAVVTKTANTFADLVHSNPFTNFSGEQITPRSLSAKTFTKIISSLQPQQDLIAEAVTRQYLGQNGPLREISAEQVFQRYFQTENSVWPTRQIETKDLPAFVRKIGFGEDPYLVTIYTEQNTGRQTVLYQQKIIQDNAPTTQALFNPDETWTAKVVCLNFDTPVSTSNEILSAIDQARFFSEFVYTK